MKPISGSGMVGRAAAWRGEVRYGLVGLGKVRHGKVTEDSLWPSMLQVDRENEQLAGRR
jgi:hypothetical protein